ncbi:hypothetical protein HanRHA438_Chr05g0211801 [Helianthus annuus]|uniref:Uncharacterized protein n=1 Tax=Helianthus annuus TaxID=4232 RepID=A0A251UPM9_HELAN|nr:hypothetical protein HanXRQr2_Chr05g0201921 [Helianthus annuus]KAJ0569417.1 hypothetical protein HanHA300_Chr05g0165951 [Helianthus annuus]KAJ0575891.1 hypothetical protein HanIR_Chr05g0217961 [Helianthus annuus]KAJ0583725.1 hypothetical protein HanHA89_Chr05g0179971 [Helianthus annuus]KAJ0746448.1 hypothetical protein HanOQP8_Chr05g0177721 [Helianthus annuus]
MGTCFSSKRSKAEVASETIRVVHMDGSLQDYEDPATVDQVITNFPMHYLCTPVEIFQSGLVPLQLNHQLKTGQIYFVLPNTTLKFNTSPDDLTILTRKLMNIAKTARSGPAKSVPRSPSASMLHNPQGTSQTTFLDHRCGDHGEVNTLNSPKSPIWKPVMDTIVEG